MKKLTQLSLTVIFFLTSCYSFNRIEIKPAENKITPTTKVEETIQVEANKLALAMVEEMNKKNKTSCPIFTMPVLPKTPELPYSELNKIKQGDIKALLELEQTHIEDLRSYIILVKQILQKTQLEYIANCQAISQ